MPTSGDLKLTGAGDCETSVTTLFSPALSATTEWPILTSQSHQSWIHVGKLQWVSSARSGLMLVISGAFFYVSFFSERSHPYPTMPCTATTEKSALSWPLVFFPCSPFREPIWGIELIKPAENKIILKITERLTKKVTRHNTLLNLTTLLFLTHGVTLVFHNKFF